MINKIALFIWRGYLFKGRKENADYSRTKDMLSKLNPGKEKERLFEEYCIRKIEREMIFGLLGTVLIVIAVVCTGMNHIIDEENRIERKDNGQNEYATTIIAEYKDEQYEMDISVKGKEYTKYEINSLYEECADRVEEIILGNNESLGHVEEKLDLIHEVEGFPFYILWETKDYELIHNDGTIGEKKLSSGGEKCLLIASFSYEDYLFEKEYCVSVYPKTLSWEQAEKEEIIASIQKKQEETKYESHLQLPTSIGNEMISWKEPVSGVPLMLATLLMVTLAGIWLGTDNDLAKKYKNRNRLLSLEYSEFVSKLQLLIGSGMTLRNAFERMGDDYRFLLQTGGERKYVYEELLLCIKKIRDGSGEEESYTFFGNRCGLISYKKLMTMLIQNMKKGTDGLLDALNNETKLAFEERKQIARRMGEEAQTKLLFPMIIMLVVVMIIIIIPAYASFGV